MKKQRQNNGRPRLSRRTKKAIRELKEHYELGCEASAETRPGTGKSYYNRGAVANFAAEHRTRTSPVYLDRQFAETYSEEEFDELIELSVEHDFPIGISHASELIRVPDPEIRARLIEKAAQERWTLRQLQAERRAVMRALQRS